MFSCSIWPLLPVSIAEMPSIMMLFWPAPPRRVAPAPPKPPVVSPVMTPGVNATTLMKLPRVIGQILDLRGLDGERPLGALRSAPSTVSAVTFTVSAMPPASSVIAGTPTRSAPLTRMPVRRTVLKPSSADFDRVGVGRDVGKHVVAGRIGQRPARTSCRALR